MNTNNYSMNRNYQSSSSLCPPGSQQQQPYMFGNLKTISSSSNIGQRRGAGNESVRDCMHWPQSLAPGQASGSHYGSNNNQYEGSSMRMPQYGRQYTQQQMQQSQQQYYPQPKAYIQLQGGQGQGEKSMEIQCQMGPSGGSQMPAMPQMEPLMIKVVAPPGAGANGQPIQFKISPNSLWGQQR